MANNYMTEYETGLAASASVLSISLAAISAYEAYALYTKKVPAITTIVRNKIAEAPKDAVVVTGFFGLLSGWLIGHLGQ